MDKKVLKDKKAIFVDYFDTLVFRKIGTKDVAYRWAYILKNKYLELKDISIEDIVAYRKQITYDLKNQYDEIPYNILLQKIKEYFEINEDITAFANLSFEIEVALENGVQYLNKKLYKLLKKEKQNGKKIYLISDFYLSKKAYEIFFEQLNIKDLFDDIFISVDYNKTKRKHDGLLYSLVLEKVDLKREEVVMIGDNSYSDYKVPKSIGIKAILYKSKKKYKANYLEYSNKILKVKRDNWKKELYTEYSYVFYVFMNRLYEKAKKDGVNKLTFLSREGLMLKKMFDIYQKIKIPNSDMIETYYVYNSRKLNKKVKEEIENNGISEYVNYLSKFHDAGYLNIVDTGWNNSAQESISQYANIKTRGYYIGTFSKNKLDYECNRVGLLYDIREDGSTSDYYWSLRTNFTLVEQLLAADHGSVEEYKDNEFIFKWVDIEKKYYEKYIRNIQNKIILYFKQLCIWSNEDLENISNKKLARMTVKTGLFANKERIKFLIDSDEAYYDNFSNNDFKGSFRGKKRNIIEKLFHPEKKLSLFVKRQRRIQNKKFAKSTYFIWAFGLYTHLKILNRI